MNDEAKMSFMEHLEELRKRLIRAVLAVFIGMIICWFFREQILAFLLSPLYEAWNQVDGLPEPKPLNFSSMLEPFIAYLKMSAIGGLFLGAPVVLYQLWKFIAPGLYLRERRLAVPFVLVSSLLFIGGAVGAYTVVFPIGFKFFLDFAAGREMIDLSAEVTVAAEKLQKEPAPKQVREDRDIDAGIADAGITDAGPSSRSVSQAMTDVPANAEERVPPAPAKEAGETWYEWMLGRLTNKGCGNMHAETIRAPRAVRLTFRWHTARCGELPPLDKLRRDDQRIALDWKPALEAEPGYGSMYAEDQRPPPGEHRYTIAVPQNPGMKQLAPVLMVKDYLSFAIRLLLAFGLVFELPILISFLSLAGIVNYKQLISFSRWFLVISVVMGAMLTPPDVVTQILLAMPLMVLYFLSVIFAYIFGPKPD